MPWMLIAHDNAVGTRVVSGATALAPAPQMHSSEASPTRQEPHGCRPESLTGAAYDAWVMHGDLRAALFQAGVCTRLCIGLPPPTALYCGGYATINAVLAACGGTAALNSGWEMLRSNRLLFDAGLRGVPLLTTFAGHGTRIEKLLCDKFSKPTAGRRQLQVYARVDDAYREIAKDLGKDPAASLAARAMRDTSQADSVWVASVEAAISAGARKILLIGSSSADADATPAEATRVARAAGAELATIRFHSDERPRVLDFVWPGSGVPERLMIDGAAAAEAWLGSLAGVTRTDVGAGPGVGTLGL